MLDDAIDDLSRLKGKSIDKAREKRDQERSAAMVAQLKGIPSTQAWKSLPDDQRNFRSLLSGETSINSAKVHQLNTSHLQNFVLTDPARRMLTLHRQYDTGADLKKLSKERPNERYKFYMSLDLNTPEKQHFAREFSSHLVAQCKERAISLTSKSMDHDYDSWNLYTWHPRELAEVLKMLYPQYQDTGIFQGARHWMQGPLPGIPISHVGWVQEPVSGGDSEGKSHSARMSYLGGALDEGKSYEEACKTAGVRRSAPWLLDEGDRKS